MTGEVLIEARSLTSAYGNYQPQGRENQRCSLYRSLCRRWSLDRIDRSLTDDELCEEENDIDDKEEDDPGGSRDEHGRQQRRRKVTGGRMWAEEFGCKKKKSSGFKIHTNRTSDESLGKDRIKNQKRRTNPIPEAKNKSM
jgi:hypothetical protein